MEFLIVFYPYPNINISWDEVELLKVHPSIIIEFRGMLGETLQEAYKFTKYCPVLDKSKVES